MPHRETFEIELCKTGYDVYRINTGVQWNQKSPRPDNHYILPEGVIPNYIAYDIFLIPHHQYDDHIIKQISSNIQVPTIQVDDIGAVSDGSQYPFGWAKNISESSEEFVAYWKMILKQHARFL
jgi:glutaredoxin